MNESINIEMPCLSLDKELDDDKNSILMDLLGVINIDGGRELDHGKKERQSKA